jgi:Domain of unknown function (DUF222)
MPKECNNLKPRVGQQPTTRQQEIVSEGLNRIAYGHMIEHMFARPLLRHIHDIRKVLSAHVRCLVPDEVPLGEAAEMWAAFDAIERHAAAAKTLLAARVDESRAWATAGDSSAEEHLARTGGTSRGAARSRLETSRRLRGLPATEAALRRGELSQAQAETVADAATANPGAERSLLDTARTSTLVRLREHANRAKAAADADADATYQRLHSQRRLRRFTDGEGAWNLQARGTADDGAVLNAALDSVIDEIFRDARRAGRYESREAYAFDAMITLARRARGQATTAASDTTGAPAGTGAAERRGSVEGETEPMSSGTRVSEPARATAVPARPAAPPDPRPPASNPSFLALLRVDVEALTRGRVDGDELCEISGVGAVPARVARGLLGDAVLKLVITRGIDVVNVTSLGRGPTAAQRVALLWASPACTNSDCDNTLGIEHDHRTPWTDVHETTLDNLDRLCRNPCHARKTHEGWALVPGAGRRPLVPPDDPRHPANSGVSPPSGAAPPVNQIPPVSSGGEPAPTLFDNPTALPARTIGRVA